MNFGWLTNIFSGILNVFSPLKAIEHWKIWAQMKTWYDTFKKWRDWYRDHILKPFKAQQAALKKLREQFVMPVIKLIDHIRQLSQVIGIFNKGLAEKLDFQFLRVEQYLLKPFNDASSRINTITSMFNGFMTPLGYFDRDTLLNSIWRDAGIIKQILYNPHNVHPAAAPLPTTQTVSAIISDAKQYLENGTGPFAKDVDEGVKYYKSLKAELGL